MQSEIECGVLGTHFRAGEWTRSLDTGKNLELGNLKIAISGFTKCCSQLKIGDNFVHSGSMAFSSRGNGCRIRSRGPVAQLVRAGDS